VLKKDSFLATKSFNTDMDKMLARKANMFEKGEINRSTAILTIVKCLHKVTNFFEKINKKKISQSWKNLEERDLINLDINNYKLILISLLNLFSIWSLSKMKGFLIFTELVLNFYKV